MIRNDKNVSVKLEMNCDIFFAAIKIIYFYYLFWYKVFDFFVYFDIFLPLLINILIITNILLIFQLGIFNY